MRDTSIFALALVVVFLAVTIGYFLAHPAHSAMLYPAIATQVNELDAVQEDGIAMIDINRADEHTLTLLDGIGEALAARIIQYREEYGPFQSLEDLTEVKGIGEATLERIRERAIAGKTGNDS